MYFTQGQALFLALMANSAEDQPLHRGDPAGVVVTLLITAAGYVLGGPYVAAVLIFLAVCVALVAWTRLGDWLGLRGRTLPSRVAFAAAEQAIRVTESEGWALDAEDGSNVDAWTESTGWLLSTMFDAWVWQGFSAWGMDIPAGRDDYLGRLLTFRYMVSATVGGDYDSGSPAPAHPVPRKNALYPIAGEDAIHRALAEYRQGSHAWHTIGD